MDCFAAGSSWWGLSQGGSQLTVVWLMAVSCVAFWGAPFRFHRACTWILSTLNGLAEALLRIIALCDYQGCQIEEGGFGSTGVEQIGCRRGGHGVAQPSVPRRAVNRGLLVSPLARSCWWILCLVGLRVGEAKVPGPLNFRLGVCNPNGLANKAALFAMQESDVWCVSETHLTAGGIKQFRRELSDLGSAFRWVVHGSPVLPRLEGSTVGQWAGVAMIAKCPLIKVTSHIATTNGLLDTNQC